jgi:NAD(P)-dependent dehydrogenase (short-subunit alcohol dehydrogenase family)
MLVRGCAELTARDRCQTMQIAGSVALVTGANAGLGRALARNAPSSSASTRGTSTTRQAAGVQGAKHAPADVAALVLDAVEAGHEELLADERTRNMKASLRRDLELIYPEIERQWQAGLR